MGGLKSEFWLFKGKHYNLLTAWSYGFDFPSLPFKINDNVNKFFSDFPSQLNNLDEYLRRYHNHVFKIVFVV